ncbi:MAG TPA: C25 family cysteine peptidase [Pyrinomonadaceae bacterium]|nr:C25 family cysteine peptidase [Pyrinomonadaceae bacterium]
MKYPACKLGFLRGLLSLSVSLAVLASSHAFALASFSNSLRYQPTQIEGGDELLFASATVTETGVRLEWTSKPDTDNLGFNIYRLQDGQRTRINREIIPGSLFVAGARVLSEAIALRSHSYGWFDARGTAESVYFIESVSLTRAPRLHEPLTPAFENTPGKKPFPRLSPEPTPTSGADSVDTSYREVGYPVGSSAATAQHMLASTLEDQWAIAAQTGVKIGVKKQGWYRVTQPQMAAIGFNPAVDIRNLQLFVDGLEVAINTSQSSGPFGPSDYIEFFGSGLDVPSSDVRTYYLIAGAALGKRVRGELQVDSEPVSTPAPQPSPSPEINPGNGPVGKSPWSVWQSGTWQIVAGRPVGVPFIPWIIFLPSAKPKPSEPPAVVDEPVRLPEPVASTAESVASSESPASAREPVRSSEPTLLTGGPANVAAPEVPAPVPSASAKKRPKRNTKKKRNRKRVSRQTTEPKREYSHAAAATVTGLTSFQYTVERKDRTVYFSSLLNGDVENWFGQVISNPNVPASQTINTPNPAFTAAGPARLEVRLQGVSQASHQVSVKVNDTVVGNFNFFGLASPVLTFDVPLALLQNGANTLKFTPALTGVVSIVDYARITYPHTFRADSNALKFSLLGTQTLQVDGFSSADVKVIDYSDPFNIRFVTPQAASNPGGSGSAIVIPTSNPKSKTPRLLYATAAAPEQPAALSLNQPSTLNLNSNTADLLIVTSAALRASLAPLVAARVAQGMNVDVVDVEDAYDEFGYGLHGPQAVKDFLARANSQWSIKPKYVIFAGDASLDPRGYMNPGNIDIVPTKLVDATYNETSSDDWLADFDDDGIADVPVGRLPVRTTADLDLLVSKIVNFVPPAPQKAMLVADDPTGYYFNFEDSNDEVEQLLPAGMTVQKSYRRLEIKVLTGTTSTNSGSTTVTGSGTLFTTEVQVGIAIAKPDGERLGTVASIGNNTTLTLTGNALSTYNGSYGKQDNATATARIVAGFNEGRAIVNYSGHGNVDVWTGASIFRSTHALALTNGFQKLPLVVVMDCLNGYFHDPNLLSLSEAFMKAPQGGAVAAFASSGLTLPDGQHHMSHQFYTLLYGAQPIALGDAIKIAKGATVDIDVRRTWIFFGDPSMQIR